MVNRSKRYQEAVAQVDRDRVYGMGEAINLLKTLPQAKFDEAVEVVVRLGIDPRKTDQLIRGAVSLPNGLGKTIKVVVFAEGDKAEAAKAAGADEVGSDDLAKKIGDGWMDFDVAVSTTGAMKYVRSIARVLGPRGLMPTPKAGTVTDDIAEAVNAVKAGRVEFKMDKTGSLAVVIGKRSFSLEQLQENANSALEAVMGSRPEGLKGRFVKTIYISSTMSPSVRIDRSSIAQS